MTALVLIVDDRPTNVLLMETKLSNEYFDVITAKDGYEALEKTRQYNPDLILLDVMMPGIDGFEVCRRLKSDPETVHIPVIMVTALSSRTDRLRGLESGADDFLTKPFNDVVFFARTKSLVRIKTLVDELRLRDKTLAFFGDNERILNYMAINTANAKVLLVNDKRDQNILIKEKLSELYEVHVAESAAMALEKADEMAFDVALISTQMANGTEGLQLASHLKAHEKNKHAPIIIMVNESRTQAMLKALELGINDYLLLPFDSSEMLLRVKTQVRRKRYHDALNIPENGTKARQALDPSTRLYSFVFMEKYLESRVEQSHKHHKPLSCLMMDIDHFSHISDSLGFQGGDAIIETLAQSVRNSVRAYDMPVRIEGKKFAIILPETTLLNASRVAERICKNVEATPFIAQEASDPVRLTVSIGVAQLKESEESVHMLGRAGRALETAQNSGKNQVQLASADHHT